MKRFSDFAKEALPFDGEKVAIEDLLNREIEILAYKIKASKFNGSSEECLMLSVELEGAKRVLFTGSTVLIDQLRMYGHEIPFATTIKKIQKFYTLS